MHSRVAEITTGMESCDVKWVLRSLACLASQNTVHWCIRVEMGENGKETSKWEKEELFTVKDYVSAPTMS